MKLKVSLTTLVLLGWLYALPAAAQVDPALDRELARLPRLGTIIYTTAHPDDESAATLTYLARGKNMRVVLIAMTRGEGGQNSKGSEIGKELGWIRTVELAEACAAYGVELRILGAPDFGYTKDVEETMRFWNAEELLRKFVRHIRELQPVAILSGFTGTDRDGHKQHQAAGILTRQAYKAAADPNAYPEQLAEGLQPWQTPYLLIRNWRGEGEGRKFEVPVQQTDEATGKSYVQIGWEGFRNHRTQNMDRRIASAPPARLQRKYFLNVAATAPGLPVPARVEDITPGLSRLPALFSLTTEAARREEWQESLSQAEAFAREARAKAVNNPIRSVQALVEGAAILHKLRSQLLDDSAEMTLEQGQAESWLQNKEQAFLRAAIKIAGVRLRAVTDRAILTPGEEFRVRLSVRIGKRKVFNAAGFTLQEFQLDAPAGWAPRTSRAAGQKTTAFFNVAIPAGLDPREVRFPALLGRFLFQAGDLPVELEEPVRGKNVDGKFETVSVAPAVQVWAKPKFRLLRADSGGSTQQVEVRLQANREFGRCAVRVEVPSGWYTTLPKVTRLEQAGATASLRFPVGLADPLPPGRYELQVIAGEGEETFTDSRRSIDRGPAPYGGQKLPLHLYEPAKAVFQVVDTEVPRRLRVGYIGFPDDPVPAMLEGLGIKVEPLDAEAVRTADLTVYNTLVIANRVYDSRPEVAEQTPRLLDYVGQGGVLLVEHQGRSWDPAKFAPYPGKKSSNSVARVTVETAPVRVLEPNHPVMNYPNAIGPEDWEGWVQERGLYFWNEWPEEYTPLLEMADPGEEPLRGSLLYARYGKGAYIYSGLALFRQVRAGVPGGIRLYVNLLSQSFRLAQTANSHSTAE